MTFTGICNYTKSFFIGILITICIAGCIQSATPQADSYEWEPGYLDIHHINTGRGNATFMIFPDGTNLLYDAGAVLRTGKEFADWKEHRADIHPNRTRNGGEWIARYIDRVLPSDVERRIDYAVISHFHIDHFGEVDPNSTPYADHGGYQLSGITEVGFHIPIRKMIDRGCPNYNYPVDLKEFYTDRRYGFGFLNYLRFLQYETEHNDLSCEGVVVGSDDQIELHNTPSLYPTFSVRNLKSNQLYWSGEGDGVVSYEFPEPLFNEELDTFNENPLSVAIMVQYGLFEYVTAGDIAGVNGFPNFDMETLLGSIIGPVDAMTLNHHGANDSTNENYLRSMQPTLIVHQPLHGHHYYRPVIERIRDLTSAKVLTMNADDRVAEDIGEIYDRVFLNEEGHVVIRVHPNDDGFEAMVLDDNRESLTILNRFGKFDVK